MKSYTEFLNESKDISAEKQEEASKLATQLTVIAKKYFPNSYAASNFSKSMSLWSITFQFGLIGDKSDVPNGIRRNDPVDHLFNIYVTESGYEVSALIGGLATNPEEGSYLAIRNVKTPFRKTKGDVKKIEKTFDTFFKRLKKLVDDNKDNIYGVDKIKDKYFK